MSHQLLALGETVRNPRCQPPAPLQYAPPLYSTLLLLLLRHYQFMVIFRTQMSDPWALVKQTFSSRLSSLRDIKLLPLLLEAFAVSWRLS